METPDFERFLEAVQRGEREATLEYLRHYEPYIRRIIHMRIAERHVRHVVDSVDICQSVLADFFETATPERFVFRSSDDVRRLLVTMALNKLRNWSRHEARRAGDFPEDWDPATSEPSPSRGLEASEEVALLLSQLPCRESHLLRLNRVDGLSWDEIARREGGRPDALRMRLARAIAKYLGTENEGEARHGR